MSTRVQLLEAAQQHTTTANALESRVEAWRKLMQAHNLLKAVYEGGDMPLEAFATCIKHVLLIAAQNYQALRNQAATEREKARIAMEFYENGVGE